MTTTEVLGFRTWPSPFNETHNRPLADREIRFADCTLRDGEQQAGIVFDARAKVRIGRLLDEIGVYEIEAGTVASSDEDRNAISLLVQAQLNAKISVLCRGLEADIETAARLGVWGVRLSFPVSAIERTHKLKGISDDEYIQRTLALTSYARSLGMHVIFSPFDTTRADHDFLRRLALALEEEKAVDRLRIVDTTGCALPSAIEAIVELVHSAAPSIPVEIHCHNDFGLACANTLAGVAAGADYVSSTIGGIGERCGNAATEEVAMALEVLNGYHTGLDLRRFTEVATEISELSGIPIPVNKAVVGENAFRHEAGMVVAGVLKDPFTAEAYEPELVGQRREILLGKKSGLVSIDHKLDVLGLQVADEQRSVLLDRVKEAAVDQGRAISDSEFRQLVNSL